ncbi:MAG: Nif3-like dinuclear metal center hexameric protein [Verrucomicrobiaceae bacterium]|nr:MAG: Nif3-like dinuclear metal center hexameric protein [Verrucomicrobiaceae bacterium]
MVSLDEVVRFLDQELKTSAIPDYSGAMNGLQLANSGKIGRVVAAVDASLPVIENAAEGGPGLLIVHHGMFWQGAQPVTGAFYKKLKIAMEADLAIYSSHLPLDVHPEWGNNILLARAIGLVDPVPFLEHKGQPMGLRGEWSGSRGDLEHLLREVLGGNVHVCPGGPDLVRDVAIITGGAGSEVVKVAATGVNTFITGEGPHWSYPLAEEVGMNLFYGGHYATETFGVKRVAGIVSERVKIPWSFVDHPTGL